MKENKKYVSEELPQEEIDKFGKKTAIIAGTGAGKNYWVENKLYTGRNRVLEITSRKIKKDETTFSFLEEWEDRDINHLFDKGILNDFAIMTNAGLATSLKRFQSISSFLEVLELFDYIVIDEAHSLIEDSSFSDSSFYIWEIIIRLKSPKIIFMSATLDIAFSEKLKEENFKKIDLSKKCMFVWPKKIIFINKLDAEVFLGGYDKDRKAIYFSTSAGSIAKKLLPTFKKTNVKEGDVVAIVGEGSHKKFEDVDLKAMKECTESIVSSGFLPDNVKILFTTSKLKEGINIKDKRVKTIFVESHFISDIIQFAGRVRAEADCMYIINDARQYSVNKEDIAEIEYQKAIIDGINEGVLRLGLNKDIKYITPDESDQIIKNNPFKINKLNNYIKYIEKRHTYIKFNPINGQFQIFQQKEEALWNYLKQLDLYDNNKLDLINEYFKGVKVFGFEQNMIEMVVGFLKNNKFLNVELIRKEVHSEIFAMLSRLRLANSRGEDYSDLKTALKVCGVHMDISADKEKMTLSLAKK